MQQYAYHFVLNIYWDIFAFVISSEYTLEVETYGSVCFSLCVFKPFQGEWKLNKI